MRDTAVCDVVEFRPGVDSASSGEFTSNHGKD